MKTGKLTFSDVAAPTGDPMDDPSYQRFLADTAKRCLSKHAPCAGCCAGGMCDNWDGVEDREDEEPTEPMDEEEWRP